jgi:hypothetical protein
VGVGGGGGGGERERERERAHLWSDMRWQRRNSVGAVSQVDMLKQHLRDRKLGLTGLKADLAKRLKEAEMKEEQKSKSKSGAATSKLVADPPLPGMHLASREVQGSAMPDPENAGTVKKVRIMCVGAVIDCFLPAESRTAYWETRVKRKFLAR